MWLKRRESILKQKTRIRYAEEGDSNSKYFHGVIREIRRKACLRRIMGRDGEWIEEEKEIAEAAIEHFSKIFTQPNNSLDLSITDLCGDPGTIQ